MAKCNVDAIAGAALMSRFRECLTPEEEEQLKPKFTGLCFYETMGTRNYRDCYCTRCGQVFDVWKSENKRFFTSHHNDETDCPICGGGVQLKCLGRIRNFSNLNETITAAIIRTDRNGNLMISAGLATRKISGWNDLEPYLDWTEKCRYYLSPGKVMGWRRSIDYYFSMMLGPQPWIMMKNICKPFTSNPIRGYDDTYWLIGTERLADSNFRYCQLEEWYHAETQNWLCEQDNKVRLCVEYLAEYALHPQMEMAVKLGMTGAVTDLCNGRKNHQDLNWKADKPWSFLRLDKQEAKVFLRSPSMDLLHWIHQEQKRSTGMPVQAMVEMWDSVGGQQAPKLAACALRCEVSAQKAAHYISSQGRGTRAHTAELWMDYLDMAQKLGYDLSRPDVRMPKNLRERHDAAAQTVQLERDKKAEAAYAQRLKTLREKYEFELDGLRIVVPENSRQIIAEGQTLKHCVGGYAARHIQGKTVILFLRHSRKPERSYVTVEMGGFDNNDIRQIHGYRNEMYSNAVSPLKRCKSFLNMWQAWLQSGSKRDKTGRPILPKVRKDGAA